MVVRSPITVEWKELSVELHSRYNNQIGRVIDGLGSNLGQHQNRRPLECPREEMAYKLLGNTSSLPSDANLFEVKIKLVDSLATRQHDSSNHLGGTVSPQASLLVKEMWMWCLERNITLRAQHLPGKENVVANQESRTIVKEGQVRLETKYKDIPKNSSNSGLTNRPVCFPPVSSAPSLLQLEARPTSPCFSAKLVRHESIRKPPVEPCGQSYQQDSTTHRCGSDTGNPGVVISTVVPNAI